MSGNEFPAAIAPPMVNGEVVFEAPWQARVFGLAVTMAEQGLYAWSDFQAELIREIDTFDRSASDDDTYQYFDHFERALHRLVCARGLLDESLLTQRAQAFAERPHDHDHDHDHHHHQDGHHHHD